MSVQMHPEVVQDLLDALHDEDMNDITLVGQDGVEVTANRFVLAARSKVLRRMLYGNFREAKASKIPFCEYAGVILEAVVEYCCKNEIPKFRLYIHRNDTSARRLVQLFKAADYLELNGLAKLVSSMAHNLMARYPPLACPAFDEADLDSKVYRDALLMIQCRPYVTLPHHFETGGGIGCISESKLVSMYRDTGIRAGELFLFEMLQQWEKVSGHPEPNSVTSSCAEHLQLENIEPHDLLNVVMKSGFCSEKKIMDAITQQALRASQNKVWSLSSRGRHDVERVLVEGAGSQNANGIYYRIDGLANGELYSKREVACGQQYVYTLSISMNKDKEVESRIFCSKLLTHRAVKSLIKNHSRDPTFQPLLQVIKIETIDSGEFPSSSSGGRGGNSKKITTKMQLSDGEHFISATMEIRCRSSTRSSEIVQNTLIKVLDFEKYVSDNQVALQLNKVSIISQDPGQRFGNPSYYYDLFDEQNDDESQSIISTDTPIETQICHELMRRRDAVESKDMQTLLELYSCRYPINEKPIDSKIPRSGWSVDSHGTVPSPRCRWISAQSK